MNTQELAREARCLLSERLGRLGMSLEELGGWLRESVARLIGQHVGAAVRDALATALGQQVDSDPDYTDEDRYGYRPRDGRTRQDYEEEGDGQLWAVREAYRQAEPRRDGGRWDVLLACAVQAASWCLNRGLPRASLPGVVAIGAAAALTVLLSGPVLGGIVATAGAALFVGTAKR